MKDPAIFSESFSLSQRHGMNIVSVLRNGQHCYPASQPCDEEKQRLRHLREFKQRDALL